MTILALALVPLVAGAGHIVYLHAVDRYHLRRASQEFEAARSAGFFSPELIQHVEAFDDHVQELVSRKVLFRRKFDLRGRDDLDHRYVEARVRQFQQFDELRFPYFPATPSVEFGQFEVVDYVEREDAWVSYFAK